VDNPRPEKVAVVDEVRERLRKADAVIVTEYRGLKVKDLAALRRSIAPLGAEYRVFKNTLVRIAASDDLEGFAKLLTGPTALAFVDGDAAAVTKTLRDFSKANPLLLIKGGLLGNSVLGPEATSALADLPSREVLLARLAGALAAPLQSPCGLVRRRTPRLCVRPRGAQGQAQRRRELTHPPPRRARNPNPSTSTDKPGAQQRWQAPHSTRTRSSKRSPT
jgi:large subunit ribosomal protein L10